MDLEPVCISGTSCVPGSSLKAGLQDLCSPLGAGAVLKNDAILAPSSWGRDKAIFREVVATPRSSKDQRAQSSDSPDRAPVP